MNSRNSYAHSVNVGIGYGPDITLLGRSKSSYSKTHDFFDYNYTYGWPWNDTRVYGEGWYSNDDIKFEFVRKVMITGN